ncbi:MAG: hypothetical protein RML72_02715, partial [Bacteroidia bacterium]|nr:hypothetical protein [Bacteroidia bacterium]
MIEGGQGGQKQADLQLSNLSSTFTNCLFCPSLKGGALGIAANCYAATVQLEILFPNPVASLLEVKVFKKERAFSYGWREVSASLHKNVYTNAIHLRIQEMAVKDSLFILFSLPFHSSIIDAKLQLRWWEVPGDRLLAKKSSVLHPFTPTNTSVATAECISDKTYTNANYLCAVPGCNWPLNQGCWTVTDNILFYKFNITNVPVDLSITNISCSKQSDFLQVAIYPATNPQSTAPLGGPLCSAITIPLIQSNKINGQDDPLPPGAYILAIDGSSGGSCSFKFDGSLINPLEIIGTDSTVCGKPIFFTTNVKGPYTYSWAGPGGVTGNKDTLKINAPAPAHAGVYTLTVKFPNGCEMKATHTLKVSTPPEAPTVTNNSTVPCGQQVCFTVNMPSGYAPAQFQWQAAGWSSTQKEPCRQGGANIAGTYSLTVTYAPGCSRTVTSVVTVSENFTPLPTVTHNYQNCDQTQICFTVSGVTGPATYRLIGPGSTPCSPNWSSPPSASNTICRNQLVLGNYGVEVTLANGCKATVSVSPSMQPPSHSIPNGECGPNTTLTFTVSYNDPNASHTWCNFIGWQSTDKDVTIGPPVTYGLYCLHYKYKNCIQRYCKEVSQQLPAITVNADPLACGQDLILTASGIPNATYTWSGPNNWTATGTPVTRPKPTAGGAYTVVAQNQTGTCSRTVNLKNPTIPTPTINFEGNFCSGTLSLSVTPSGYDSLKWSGPAGFSSKAFNPQIPNVQSSMSGVYTVEAFMGHCKITRTKNIQIQPLPLPNVAISPSICEGQALSFTTTNLLPGATYTWVKGTDTVSKAPNFTITPAKFSDNGTYTLVVQKTGCVRTKNYLVEVKPTPKDPSWIITNSPICEGQTLLITASKEDGATEYIWKGPGDWQSITQNDITSTIHNSRPNLSLAHAGTYSLAVQVNGCTSGFSTFGVVVMNNPSTPSAADVTRCGPGVATFTASSIAAIPFDVVSLYTTPTGGIAHQTDTQAPFELSSPPVTTETTFYLEAYSTATTCYSSTRKPVVVKILEVPGQPSAQSITQCAGSGVVIFTATMGTPPGTTIHLYTSSNATDPVFSDSNSPYHLSYSISNVNQVTTSTLYIRAEKAGCFSPIANFNLTLIPSPGPPIVNSVRRCGDGSVTFTIQFGNPSGTVIRIFTIPCQNTAIDSTLANNGTFQTPVLVSSLNSSVTYTYYFQAVDYAYGCRSECVSSSAIIDPLPTPPSGQNISRCGEGTLTFTVTASPIVSTIHFYTQSTGGNPITTVSAAPYTYTTPVLSQSTTYYVEALTNNGCRSTQRTPVVASINPLPGPPTINSVARCGGGTVTFTFSNFNNSIYRLYTVASGGNAISTAQGNSFTVGPVAQTQTFYVERTDPTTLCTSLRSEVVATIHTVPGEPSVEPVSRCQAGNVTFTARMGTPAGSRIRIYTSASATSPLQSQVGPLAQFPILLNTTTTYYFSAFDDATGCESARTSAVATISPNPNAPVAASFQRCGAGSVTISFTIPNARSGDKIMVYSNAALSQLVTESSNLPFNFTTPQLTQNTTYYLRATNTTSNCISEVSTVTIQILPIPAAPIVTDLTRCGGGNLELSFAVVDPAAKQVILYTDNQTSLPLRIQDLPSTTLPLGFQQASTTYYLSVRDKNTTCESVRVPFTITIHPIPAPPQLRAIASCGPGEVSIDITPVAPFADSYKVLDNTFQPLSALNASPWRYTTNLTTTTDFWVEAIITATGCKSNPIKITAPVYPIPPQPVIENLQRCGPGTLTFTAQFNTLLANTLLIYTQPSGADSPIQTINTFPYQYTTRTLSSTTTFYASLSNSATGCVSSRVPFIATVFALPGAPKVMENSRCGSGVISFVAEMGNPEGTAIQFYNGSNLVESKSNSPFVFSTFVETTTSFSFESIDGVTGCKSQRVTVVGTVHPIPAPPLGIARSSCQSSEVTLKFEMGVPAGNLIELYDASYSLLQVLTSPFQVSLPLNATTTYYAKSKQTSTGCVSSEFVLPVRSLTYATPATANAVERCGAGDVTFTLNTTPGHIYRVYDTPFGGQVKAQTTASQPEVTVLNITRTQTFFVESVHPQRDCPSARLPIVAYVHPAIGAPQASGVNRCGEGPVVITAVMGDPPGTAMRLYTQAQGGAPIANINNGNFSFALSSITTNMAYYLEAYDEGTGCISSRTKVEVTVLPIPPAPSSATVQRCGAGPVTFTVVSTQPVFLYNTEGTLITRDLTQPYWLSVGEIYQNQTYYVEAVNIQTGCKSPKIEVVAQLLPIPSAPLVEGNKRCGPGIVTFTVSQADFSITSIRIYNQVHSLVASGDAPLIYTTSSLQTSTLYYVSSFNGSCESEKIPVRAVLHPIPSPPVARSQSFCSGDISNLVLFTARMGNIAGTGIRLFSQAEGGNAIATSDEGPLFILPVNVSGFSTTTYYVEAFDVSSGCISGRSPVSVSVHPLPSPPPAINVSRCGPGEVRFTIPAGNYDKINLYKNSSDAAPIQSKTQFPAEFVNYESQDVSYFLETESLATGCKSERLGLRVVIYPVPSTPQLLSNSPVCEGQNLKIQVQSGVDVRYEWKGPNGFTATGAVVELNPASASHSGIYEVVALNNYGCLSPPAFLPVNVISIPSTPTVTYYRDFMRETPLCEGDELNLAVLNYPSYAEGTQFEWKGPANFRAFPHPFPGIDRPITVAHSGTYYVRAIIGQCSSAYGSIDVMVHPKPIKPVIVSNSPLCKNGDTPLTLTIQNPQQGVTYHWAGPANFHATGINHIRESNSNVGGIYSVQAITEKGCTSDVVTHTVTLYEESLNAIPIFTPKVCQGESIQIEVPLNTSDALYEWVLPSGDLIINNRNKF